jgi:aerobic-type carbon monoxide dehydrogenase small subunit (CoxS/CutS family)
MDQTIVFKLNGKEVRVASPPERKLLWVLRTELGLTGTKAMCGEGHCGACTVLLDGRPIPSCRVPVSRADGREVLTIEGLADGDRLHPLQEAFLEHDALQCGFCTPGMILQALALLRRNPDPSEAEIADALEGQLCRCGSYNRIIAAVRSAAAAMRGGRP